MAHSTSGGSSAGMGSAFLHDTSEHAARSVQKQCNSSIFRLVSPLSDAGSRNIVFSLGEGAKGTIPAANVQDITTVPTASSGTILVHPCQNE